MASSSNQSLLKNGIVLRQVVLFVIFAAVLAGGIFEFGYSRPAFKAAWDKIEEIDSSAISSDYTAEKIEEMIGKKPVEIDSSQERVEVRVYRWPSGLPFRSHDIRVVYTKLTGPLAEANPELAKERNYYSASGGTPLTSENFPAERPTMVYNFNKPSRAGGPPPAAPQDDSKSSPQLVIGDNENADKQSGDDDKKDNTQKDIQKSDQEKGDGDNKTAPESVEEPGKPAGAKEADKEADKKADESTPKGGESGGESGAEQPAENPDSGDKGEGTQEVPDGGGEGGEAAGGEGGEAADGEESGG